MRRGLVVLATGIAVLCLGVRWYARPPAPTYLVAKPGQTFEEVVKNSTFPVWEKSNRPSEYPGDLKAGATWVHEPSVIFKLDDAASGFSLPPTTFGAVTYMDNRVQSIVTSPMLKALPFDDTLTVLQALQNMFKAKGWVPWEGDNSQWFDLSPRGRQKLRDESGDTISLRVPKKNLEMFFSVYCELDCDDRPHSRWLINVEIGKKELYDWNGE
jgi:hypothetical protein